MMHLVSVVLSLCAVSLAAPSPRTNHVLHEKRAADLIDWIRARRLESHKVLPMRFGLAQRNLHRVEEMLMAVSHPDSATYGKHWTPAQVVDTFAPSKETIDAVVEWLSASGISTDRLRLSASKGWIDVNATVAEVEDLIKAEYHVYSHESGYEQIGCESYSVPADVQPHVDLIKPTVHFIHRPPPLEALVKRDANLGRPFANGRGPKKSAAKVTITPTLETCDQIITLDCLRALYSVDYTPVSTANNSFGIGQSFTPIQAVNRLNISTVEFTPQAFLTRDLDLFFRNFSPSLVGVRPKTVLIDGAIVQNDTTGFNFNGESSLDLEYAMALVNPQPITLLQTGDIIEGAGFDNWLDAVDGSFSPGGFKGPESCGIVTPPFVVSISYGQDESTVTSAFANRQCTEYAKVTCPFVTAVGATQVNPGATVNDPEGACEQVIFSGGGFSNIFPIPSYQSAAVTHFLTAHPPPFTAAQYELSQIYRPMGVDGEFSLVFGTSASSPVVGSLITLVNDARIARGKGPVGFINPAIYSAAFASAFNDITSGGNQGCGTAGFTATNGWDPVTVHETRAADPLDWKILRRLEGHKILPMRFGLAQRNLHDIEDMLMAVSHPDSPTYGQHLSPFQVLDTFSPSGDTVAAVANWLTDSGISRERLRLSVGKGWIDLNATVREVESLLKTEYHIYSHSITGDEQISAWLFVCPAEIH
ncbi:hypothetical protein H0H87_006677 [Tephrocybe sp. NHM501043]|nr:hypothetical protein H0H87_006677 [Tephrocybe sp. NHM501043]